jgi:hypothetical protein
MNHHHCPTCDRTYGQVISDRPDRCGVCITGLSIDGRAIYPTKIDGRLVCPMCRAHGATCNLVPHDEWPGAWQHDFSHLFPEEPS